MADLQPAQDKSADHDPLTCELCHAEGMAAELEHARHHRPPDRPDSYCVDCPFSDRGDWVMYRHEFDSWMRELADLRARASTRTRHLPVYGRGGVVVEAVVDAEDFEALSQYRWHLGGKGYVQRNVTLPDGPRTAVTLHRDLLGLERGDGLMIDHINHDKLDNRRANLRVVTNAENGQNRRGSAQTEGRTSRFRGVHWYARTGRWQARFGLNGEQHHVGFFDTEEAAGTAAAEARREHMPFSVERHEYEALKEAEAERDRYRKTLLRIWVGDTGPAESIQQFAFWAVHPPEGFDA